MKIDDTTEGRPGKWMHVDSGGRFYPQDPRPEEIHIGDIANGLASLRRYAGQGDITKHYSVGEHSVLMAEYAMGDWMPANVCLAVLLHDAAEGLIGELIQSVKHAVGDPYRDIERNVQAVILGKYGVLLATASNEAYIKDLDRRIVPLEKAAIMRNPQPWDYDRYEPLKGVLIRCWDPPRAKRNFLELFNLLNRRIENERSNQV